MAISLRSSFVYKRLFAQKEKTSGFTLLELLVSMLVAGVIVSGLLYLVVELLQMDRREAALTQTQRDMQRAIDYIADDVREAVYVYSDPTDVLERVEGGDTIKGVSDLPTDSVPILAFWRPVEQELSANMCDSWAPGASNEDEAMYDRCQVLEIRQASYNLVIYAQKARSDTDTVWKGSSRIIRYELDKYDGPIANLDITPGYQDPTSPDVGFDSWVAHPDSGDTDGTSNVLVDFVDTPADMSATVASSTNPCEQLGLDTAQYDVVPSGLLVEHSPSFLGCIRKSVAGSAVDDAGSNSNQDIYLYLRGNAVDGTRGSVNSFSEESSLPTLETRVLMRGVVNKNPT